MMWNHTQWINKTLSLWYNMTKTEQLVTYIRNGVNNLLPNLKVNFEVDGDGNINVGDVTVMPCVIERPSIAGIKEFPGWEVTTSKFVASGSYWEMDDVDIVERGKSDNLLQVASLVCKVLFEDSADAYFENIATDEWAKEEQEWGNIASKGLRQWGTENSENPMKFMEDQTLSEESAKVLDEMLEQPRNSLPETRSPKMKKASTD